jgi:hypothetical protein
MSATAIHAWLNSHGAFHVGVALLREQWPVYPALDFLLSLGETSVSRARLSAALQNIHTASVRRTLATPDRPGVHLVTKAELHASQQALGQVPPLPRI